MTAAETEAGVSVPALVGPRNLDLCVVPPRSWGEANRDGAVNIIDAQQVERFSVGLSAAGRVGTAVRVEASPSALPTRRS